VADTFRMLLGHFGFCHFGQLYNLWIRCYKLFVWCRNPQVSTYIQTRLPDFSWHKIPKQCKINYLTTKYTKWPRNLPNEHKIYKHFLVGGPPKYTKFGIFGMKINHLATLSAKHVQICCHNLKANVLKLESWQVPVR
jgi:hypothetical protein